eukprot:6202227-Pleurochrysis_carterae.AAC.2
MPTRALTCTAVDARAQRYMCRKHEGGRESECSCESACECRCRRGCCCERAIRAHVLRVPRVRARAGREPGMVRVASVGVHLRQLRLRSKRETGQTEAAEKRQDRQTDRLDQTDRQTGRPELQPCACASASANACVCVCVCVCVFASAQEALSLFNRRFRQAQNHVYEGLGYVEQGRWQGDYYFVQALRSCMHETGPQSMHACRTWRRGKLMLAP